jgi:spore coat protein U-like protein
MNRLHTSIAKAVVLGAIAAASTFASAGDTQNLSVTATVTGLCKFSSAAQTFTFGTLDPSAAVLTNGSGASVTYKCTKGTAATSVSAGNGLNFVGSRRMTNGTDFIPYTLTVAGGTQTGLGFSAGKDLSLTLTGSVAAAAYQDVSSGNYADTVVLTVAP